MKPLKISASSKIKCTNCKGRGCLLFIEEMNKEMGKKMNARCPICNGKGQIQIT